MEGNASKVFTQAHRTNAKQCTDLIWLLLFSTFWIILIAIAVFGVIYGNYLPIVNGYDSFGNTCGVKDNKPFNNFILSGTDTSNKKNLLFLGYTNIPQVVKICVERCISEVLFAPGLIYLESQKTNSQLCRYDFDMKVLESVMFKEYTNSLGPCPEFHVYESFPVKHRCIPLDTAVKRLNETYSWISVDSGPFQDIFTNVYQAWPYICALIILAFVVSVGMLSLMRWKPTITFHATCFLALVCGLAFCIHIWIIIQRMPAVARDVIFDFTEEDGRVLYHLLKDFRVNKTVINVLGVVGVLLMEAFLIVLLFTKGDILRVVILCKEAINCWRQVPSLIGFALGTSMAMVMFFCFWTYAILCIATASEKQIFPLGNRADYEDDPMINFRLFEKIEYVEVASIRNCCWIYIFGFVWTSEFICGCQQFCLETAVAKWYFRRPTTQITWSLFRHHLGSVARGSFQGMFNIPRLLLTYICEVLKKVTDCSPLWSVRRGLELIEGHLKMYRGVYAIVEIQQIDLYPAGRIASATLATCCAEDLEDISNAVYFVFFSAKLMVANLTCLLGILLLKDQDNLFFYMAPVLLSGLFAVYFAHIVLSTIETTANTLFLCVCEDKDINKARGRWTEGNLIKFSGGAQPFF